MGIVETPVAFTPQKTNEGLAGKSQTISKIGKNIDSFMVGIFQLVIRYFFWAGSKSWLAQWIVHPIGSI